jgi:hypothetical protein
MPYPLVSSLEGGEQVVKEFVKEDKEAIIPLEPFAFCAAHALHCRSG